MHSFLRFAAPLLTACALAALPSTGAAQAPGPGRSSANPACTLLTLAEMRSASGQQYDHESEGDAMGEGLGGGASCQWGGPSFGPGEERPLLSLILVPIKGRSLTEGGLKAAPRKGCTREKLSGIGEVAFLETCESSRGPVAYAKAGTWDVVVQMDAKPPATAASVKPAILAVAKAAAARLKAKS